MIKIILWSLIALKIDGTSRVGSVTLSTLKSIDMILIFADEKMDRIVISGFTCSNSSTRQILTNSRCIHNLTVLQSDSTPLLYSSNPVAKFLYMVFPLAR